SLRIWRIMPSGDSFGPETNLWIGPRASIRNFTCMPPTSTTRMWRALTLPGIFLLARIGLDYARPAARRAMLGFALWREQRKAGAQRFTHALCLLACL